MGSFLVGSIGGKNIVNVLGAVLVVPFLYYFLCEMLCDVLSGWFTVEESLVHQTKRLERLKASLT